MSLKNKSIRGKMTIARIFLVIFFVCLFSICSEAVSLATTITLQWEAIASASGYKVFYQADSYSQPFANSINVQNQTTVSISNLNTTHSYYFAVVAYDASLVESSYSNIVAIHPLAVNLSGSGSGSVNSDPSAITCVSGTCVSQFGSGSSLTLYATPSNNSTTLSYFSGWSGACSGTSSNCTVDITASKSVTATFVSLDPVHIAGGSYYTSLQSAYGAASNNANIQTQEVTIAGNFTASSTNTITIKGGYNANYSDRSGYTVMEGTLSVAQGTLIVDNLVIR